MHWLNKTIPFVNFLADHKLLQSEQEVVILNSLIAYALKKRTIKHTELCQLLELLCKPELKIVKRVYGKRQFESLVSLITKRFHLDDLFILYKNPYGHKDRISKYTGRYNELIRKVSKLYGIDFSQCKSMIYHNWIETSIEHIFKMANLVKRKNASFETENYPLLQMANLVKRKNASFETENYPQNFLRDARKLPFNRLKADLLFLIRDAYRQIDPNLRCETLRYIGKLNNFRINPKDENEPVLLVTAGGLTITYFF